MRSMITCRIDGAPKPITQEVLRKAGFHHCLYLGSSDAEEAIIRVAIVNIDGTISALTGDLPHDSRSLSYQKDLGYQVTRMKAH